MKHYIFIAVDYQYGFKEGGSLGVDGATKAIEAASKLLNHRVPKDKETCDEQSHSDRDTTKHEESFIKETIFTRDGHPANHCSFKHNGGEWPVHCVEYTMSSAIVDPLIFDCIHNGIPYGVVTKGQDPMVENYSAFKYVMKNDDLHTFSLAPDFNPVGNVLDFMQDKDDVEENYNEIIIGGVAGDYCVYETVDTMKALDPIVYLPGIASIDGGEKLNKLIKDLNLRVMDETFSIKRLS
jgi:nicotinamidase-related amidase